MRYNPATDRARYTLDEIAEQCRAAIMKAKEPVSAPCSWDEVAALQKLAEEGDEDAEFYAENPVLWGFAWEQDLMVPAAAF